MGSFVSVINEAQRNFKDETGEEADTVFLTAIGMKALRNCVGGCSIEYLSSAQMPDTFDDGDRVMGFTVRFTDEKLLCGFRISSSQITGGDELNLPNLAFCSIRQI
jgi:hypothetical protein